MNIYLQTIFYDDPRLLYFLLQHGLAIEDIAIKRPKEVNGLLKKRKAIRNRLNSCTFCVQTIQSELNRLAMCNVHVSTIDDADYPILLKQIADPPRALFYKGDISVLANPCVSIVGARRALSDTQHFTYELGQVLSMAGFCVVSGLAYGVDAIAHTCSLDIGGHTVAVVGHGLQTIYPAAHRQLAQRITNSGLIISEFPYSVGVLKHRFPQRNRLISGLSVATIIAQAAEKSGTLITARLTIEQNRELFVVPGHPMYQQYKGSNELIKQGAILLNDPQDCAAHMAELVSRMGIY